MVENYWSAHRLSRRGMLRASGLTGAGLAGAALLGCGDDEEAPPTTPAGTSTVGTSTATATQTPVAGDLRSGGTLVLTSSTPTASWNPVVNSQQALSLANQHIYDNLLSPRLQGPVLNAADNFEMVDEVTAVFRLKEGMVYQDRAPVDGRAVEAEDIAVMHEYVRDETQAVERIFQSTVLDYVETPDPQTVVFHLLGPSAYLLTASQLGVPHNNAIVPRELVLGDFENTEPVGSGPYQQKAYQTQVRYEYERNPTFRDADRGLPYIDERVRIVIDDNSAMEAAFLGENIHAFFTPPAETATRLINDLGDQLAVEEFLALNLETWNMASSREWFDDIRVREAFYRAFDAQQYIDLVANGWAVPVPGKVTAGLTKYQLEESETAPYVLHDPEAARQLLDAAGFDFNRNYTLTTITGAENESSLQVFAEQIRRVGVENVSYVVAPPSEWLGPVSNTGNYDFCVVRHGAFDNPQRALRLHHTDSLQIHTAMNIRDPEVDALIEESEQLVDEAAHVEKVKDVQRALLERYSHLSYVFAQTRRELRRAYVMDWEPHVLLAAFHRTECWLDQ